MAVDTWDDVLFPASEGVLSEMTTASSGDDVRVVVERVSGNGTERILIANGRRQTEYQGPRVDTGDPRNLTAFLEWRAEEYKAERTALLIFSHGNGVADWYVFPKEGSDADAFPCRRVKRSLDRKPPFHPRKEGKDGIGFTDHYHDFLTLSKLREGIAGAGVRIDLIGLDACLMGMVEIAYELRGLAPWLLASEPDAAYSGWPYGNVLAQLVRNPGQCGDELAGLFLDKFTLHTTPDAEPATLAMIALDEMDRVAADFDGIATRLSSITDRAGERAGVELARQEAYEVDIYGYIDAGGLLRALARNGFDVGDGVASLERAVRRCAKVTEGPPPALSGMSIYFPDYKSQKSTLEYYDRNAFSARTKWGHFLARWLDSAKG